MAIIGTFRVVSAEGTVHFGSLAALPSPTGWAARFMHSQAAIIPHAHIPEAQIAPSVTKARPHIGFFDGIRGSLCLYVMVFHCAIMSGFFTRLLPGPIAVDLFMLISGFFMTYTLSGKKTGLTGDAIVAFYLRRLLRVVPVYYIVLLVAAAFFGTFMQFAAEAKAVFPPPWAAKLGNDPSRATIDFTNVILHMTFLFGLNPHYAANLPTPDWSLTLEMQFYAVIPFLLIAFRKYGLVIPFVILAIANYLAFKYIGLYLEPKVGGLWPQPSLLVFKIDCFLTGILLSFYFFDDSFNKVEVMALLIVSLALEGNVLFSLVFVFCFACLEGVIAGRGLFVSTARQLAKLLQTRVLRFLAAISYDLYLIHPMILVVIMHMLLKSHTYIGLPPIMRFAVLLGLGLMMVIPVSYLLHITIERPCQNASRAICAWVLDRKKRLLNPAH